MRAVELCVGAGGLALGISRAGFDQVTVADSDEQACETLRRNKDNNVPYVRNWNIIEADISELDFSQYIGIDLLSGGPPCQPFSHGGKRDGRSDETGDVRDGLDGLDLNRKQDGLVPPGSVLAARGRSGAVP